MIFLSNDGLFKIQSDAIRKLAETESCVLVGRCADYILRDDPACLSFFIHSSVESRVQKDRGKAWCDSGRGEEHDGED